MLINKFTQSHLKPLVIVSLFRRVGDTWSSWLGQLETPVELWGAEEHFRTPDTLTGVRLSSDGLHSMHSLQAPETVHHDQIGLIYFNLKSFIFIFLTRRINVLEENERRR